MSKTIQQEVSTKEAPAAIGPYSQAIRCNNLLFISGQIPLNPASGELAGQDVETQTNQVLINLGKILAAEGLGFENLVKTTIFIKDMGQFSVINSVYENFMKKPYPARATVEVARLPKDVLVEIDGIACYPS